MDLTKKQTTVRRDQLTAQEEMVLKVIEANPGVHNNDADLIAAVWRSQGWSDNRGLEQNLSTVTRSESITRRRRSLWTQGFIKYTKDAENARYDAYKSERDNHAAISWL